MRSVVDLIRFRVIEQLYINITKIFVPDAVTHVQSNVEENVDSIVWINCALHVGNNIRANIKSSTSSQLETAYKKLERI